MASDEKKTGFFKRIGNYFREMKTELKKVVWPTFKQVRSNTGIVIAVLVLVGAIILVMDFGLEALIKWLLAK
ncbi:MAG: preprotein translocase subunit SecE [Clostridia bacterium]|nr:preprotein translocase subunit SecE [Clostridia bacterium]MBQ3553668.1 preprotein translocase subunit SecE [Clostridia bacterium]